MNKRSNNNQFFVITILLLIYFDFLYSQSAQDEKYKSICENAQIPLEYVSLGAQGGVCIVKQSANPQMTQTNNWDSYTCNQDAFTLDDLLNVTMNPRTDACPKTLGACNPETGKCETNTNNTYYKDNFGVDWTGLNTWKQVTMTTYSGSAACLGDVGQATSCLQSNFSIDGMAAVVPQMYGKWGLYSQGCFANNDICYNITGPTGKSQIVAIGGRCGGYGQCGPAADFTSLQFTAPQLSGIENTDPQSGTVCMVKNETFIFAGITPSCIYQKPAPEGFQQDHCCPDKCYLGGQLHYVDWCAMNDHPHFDLSINVFLELCGSLTIGTCVATYTEPIVCPNWLPDSCLGYGVIKCPLHGYPQADAQFCESGQQLNNIHGVYTQCCCNNGYIPSKDGFLCEPVNKPQQKPNNTNTQPNQPQQKNNSAPAECYCNVAKGQSSLWSGLCSKACNNQTYCNKMIQLCEWSDSKPCDCQAKKVIAGWAEQCQSFCTNEKACQNEWYCQWNENSSNSTVCSCNVMDYSFWAKEQCELKACYNETMCEQLSDYCDWNSHPTVHSLEYQ